MNAYYSIVVDRARGALRIAMGGFFMHSDVDAFQSEVYMKLAQLGLRPNQHLMLCDVREMKIQMQEIVAAFSHVVGNPRSRSKRLAFVTGSSLSRLQAKRLSNRDGIAYFADMALAQAWLFDPAHDAVAIAAE